MDEYTARELTRVRRIASEIKFNNWEFYVGRDDTRLFLQVQFCAPCNDNPSQPIRHHGRKWFLSPHMTKSEIVQTALKAVLSAVEHEAREQFLYNGYPIFGPHWNVDELVELAANTRQDVRLAA